MCATPKPTEEICECISFSFSAQGILLDSGSEQIQLVAASGVGAIHASWPM
ncbi:hypothetical protein COMA1_11219 [Candidatus Nitrospira nitrosa]|uniref:Uncharacterized protein n=1 Tax=Candidatus Nitrospira nitrosa TaxID=1742972 RepID=A0A0S4L7P2_9BACT|nr:hypothetical protein COMA1_11219 [Candidatus Nitrospira nitrosa]